MRESVVRNQQGQNWPKSPGLKVFGKIWELFVGCVFCKTRIALGFAILLLCLLLRGIHWPQVSMNFFLIWCIREFSRFLTFEQFILLSADDFIVVNKFCGWWLLWTNDFRPLRCWGLLGTNDFGGLMLEPWWRFGAYDTIIQFMNLNITLYEASLI